MIDLLDTGGDLNLVVEGIKKLIDITDVRNETSAGPKEIKLGIKFTAAMGTRKE